MTGWAETCAFTAEEPSVPVPPSRAPLRLPHVVCSLVLLALLAGCGAGGFAGTERGGEAKEQAGVDGVPGPPGATAGVPSPALPVPPVPAASPQPTELPGLGPNTRAAVPATARQAFVVTGDSA